MNIRLWYQLKYVTCYLTVQTRLVPILDHLWNLCRRFPVDILKWRTRKTFKTIFFSGHITQNKLFVSLKQDTKPDKKSSKVFWCTGFWLEASAEHTSLSFKMNKFKILISFLFLRPSFAERERGRFRNSWLRSTREFIAFKLLYITGEERTPYIGEISGR